MASKNKFKARQGSFIKSAVVPTDYPQSQKLEIAIAGRSNAGKSSFINALVGKSLAKVSQVPGKTRLLNFFAIGDSYTLVDMPGYGFASRSGGELQDWRSMIEVYLSQRKNLVGLILIMDVRRDWDEDERLLKGFCEEVGLPVALVLTKKDKISKTEAQKRLEVMRKKTKFSLVFALSNNNEEEVRLAEDEIFRSWVKQGQTRKNEEDPQ